MGNSMVKICRTNRVRNMGEKQTKLKTHKQTNKLVDFADFLKVYIFTIYILRNGYGKYNRL